MNLAKREAIMPTDTILMLVAVVAMFAGFLAVLAWGDAQTRNLPQRIKK